VNGARDLKELTGQNAKFRSKHVGLDVECDFPESRSHQSREIA
jgi:hypothetical protein